MNRNVGNLILILVLVSAVIWLDLPDNPGIHIGSFNRDIKTVLGLDLQGGLQVLMEVDLPAESTVTQQNLEDARQILENRSNGLGVSEVVFQTAGTRRLVGEFPGLKNQDELLAVLKETGQLEFVDMGTSPMSEGSTINTDYGINNTDAGSATPGITPSVAIANTGTPGASTPSAMVITPTGGTVVATQTQASTGIPGSLAITEVPTATAPVVVPTALTPEEQVYHTIMTGKDLKSVSVSTDQLGKPVVHFELNTEGAKIFGDFTTANINKYLAIVLDKKIISAPIIKSAITEGSGIIEGNFTRETANNLAIQLRYGSLPVPLKIVQISSVGATLGQDSIQKSLVAGIVGLLVVVLFMTLNYRLPGIVASLALLVYALITYSLFRLIPVTLTLPGIAGVALSIGVAVDANILIFERMKEELRAGRTISQAIDLGWKRAWLSIRDSNISTLITCIILFWFGSTFGASIVKGFALTLAIGVVVSLFTAIIVTRTFLHAILDNMKFAEHPKWFGVR